MISFYSRKIIGVIGAASVFVLGILALMFVEYSSAQWYVGLTFVIISIVYFIVAIFLKSKPRT